VVLVSPHAFGKVGPIFVKLILKHSYSAPRVPAGYDLTPLHRGADTAMCESDDAPSRVGFVPLERPDCPLLRTWPPMDAKCVITPIM